LASGNLGERWDLWERERKGEVQDFENVLAGGGTEKTKFPTEKGSQEEGKLGMGGRSTLVTDQR